MIAEGCNNAATGQTLDRSWILKLTKQLFVRYRLPRVVERLRDRFSKQRHLRNDYVQGSARMPEGSSWQI